MARFFLYQSHVRPPTVDAPTEPDFGWFTALKDPVRPALAVAIVASGFFGAPFIEEGPSPPGPATKAVPNFISTAVYRERRLLYQGIANPIVVAQEEVTVDKWYVAFTDPPKPKSGLASQYQQTVAYAYFTPETVTSDKWFATLSEPIRVRRFATAQQQVSATDTDPIVSFSYYNLLSEPVRLRRFATALQDSVADVAFNEDTSTLEPKWHRGWPDKLYAKTGILAGQQQFLAFDTFPRVQEIVTLDKWYQAFREPVRFKPGLSARYQQTLAWGYFTPESITPDKWFTPFTDPPKPKVSIRLGSQQVSATDTDPIVSFSWFINLSDPVRQKPGLRTALQRADFIPPFVEDSTFEAKWNQPWSEPLRRKRPATEFPALAYNYNTQFEVITEDKWHQPWTIPVRVKPGLRPGLNQAVAFSPNPVVSFGWFGRLETPVRQRPGLRTAIQQWTAFTPAAPFPENVKVASWLEWMGEPVRTKPGLGAWLQQNLAWLPRLLPPSVIVTMAAVEDNQDTFEGIITTSAPAARCLVSIEEIAVPQQSPTSIRET